MDGDDICLDGCQHQETNAHAAIDCDVCSMLAQNIDKHVA